MSEVSLERQFHGTVVLATLHLRRVAQSNDVDAGFAAARELGMISEQHEAFMRACFELDSRLQAATAASAGRSREAREAQKAECDESAPAKIDGSLLEELRACVLRLNSADPA